MTYRLIMLAALYIPLVGLTWINQRSVFAQGIGEATYDNGAYLPFFAYCMAFTLGLIATELIPGVRSLFAGPKRDLPAFGATAALAIAALTPMAMFVLFGLGGFQTLTEGVTAGAFRSGLGGGGAFGYLILKYYSPVVVCILLLVARDHGRLFSWPVPVVLALHIIIAMSFGYKSALVMCMLPPCILLFWNTSVRRLVALAGVGFVFLYAAYTFMRPSDQVAMSPIEAIAYRTFVLNSEVPWKIWNLYHHEGVELPSYISTLPALLGDRALTLMTGVSRADPEAWAATHFSVMMTHLSGYPIEYIIEQGHNNAANIFSEGLMAAGFVGALAYGFAAGALANILCYAIQNRLEARDYGAAAVGSSYFLFAFIAWMLGGGVAEIFHVAVIFGAGTAFVGARIMSVMTGYLERRRS
ncbi:MAG: hypothetical protein ACK4P4_23350 [Allorhizobium sp.]